MQTANLTIVAPAHLGKSKFSQKGRARTCYVRHGLAHTSGHAAWLSMKARCFVPTSQAYPMYGGRGIVMCAGWKESYGSFFEDMGDRPSRLHSIERKDNNGHYSCGHCEQCASNGWTANCRWATMKEQTRNRRSNVWLLMDGEKMVAKDVAGRLGVCAAAITQRMRLARKREESEFVYRGASIVVLTKATQGATLREYA